MFHFTGCQPHFPLSISLKFQNQLTGKPVQKLYTSMFETKVNSRHQAKKAG